MIKSFKHKELRQFFRTGKVSGISNDWAGRLRVQLDALDKAKSPRSMNLPGFHLHELKGQREGTWSVTVSGNWRLTFLFEGEDAVDVNLEDYH